MFGGLPDGGIALVNTARPLAELGLGATPFEVLTVAASELARTHLGRPLPGPALLGAFAAATGVVSLASVLGAIEERFTGAAAEGNAAAARAAHALLAEREPTRV